MKNLLFLVLLILIIVACEPDDDSTDNETLISIENNSTNNDQDTSFEISIDTSDLAILPEDTGGSHTPFPLDATSANFGYYLYKPSGYKDDGPKYPTIIFLHGWNPDLGNEPLVNILQSGPPKLIENGQWKPKYPFIVVSPQLTFGHWRSFQVHKFIEYLLRTYQINENRIYLTGLSLGGGGCWHYAGEIKNNYAAAIVPISATGSEHLIENLRKVPIWAFHGANDSIVKAYQFFGSVPLVRAINETNPVIDARVTVYPHLGHNAWTITYNGDGRHANQRHDKYDVDIYEWMLSYKKEPPIIE